MKKLSINKIGELANAGSLSLCYTVYTFSCLSSCFVVIIIIKHEVEYEQLLIGTARFLL